MTGPSASTPPAWESAAPRGLSYVQDLHAIAANGDIYFTAAGTGQLYLRENPAQPQSHLNGQGECSEEQKACTIHVSASEKTNGEGPNGSDRGGSQPAALMGASEDGSLAFFTSPEKLTDDANTGPEQPAAAISRDTLEGTDLKAEFIPGKHAVGVAVDGSHLYWANPVGGEIGRSDLDGNVEPGFVIAPGPTKCEIEVENEKGEEELETLEAPSTPRYVAVQGEYVYWSNTGPLGRKRTADQRLRHDRPGQDQPGERRSRRSRTGIHHRRLQPRRAGRQRRPHLLGQRGDSDWKRASAAIGRAKLNGGEAASEVEEEFFVEGIQHAPRRGAGREPRLLHRR